jgi:hypothetical protein
MKTQALWKRLLFIIGIVALIIGAIDPLEGSVLICGGAVLISVAVLAAHDRHRYLFLAATISILIGTAMLFYMSSLGGIGKGTSYSMWWALVFLPLPLGWLMIVVLLIIRAFRSRKRNKP